MATDKNGEIWLATFHKGIMKSHSSVDVQHKLDFKSVFTGAGNTVLCITSDENGNLWFGNDSSLLGYYEADKCAFSFYLLPFSGQINRKIGIRSLYIDSVFIWLGTENGLFSFNRKTKRFVSHPVKDTVIRAITGASDSSLWLGTAIGLKKYNFRSGAIKEGFEKRASVPAREIRSLLHSPDRHLYIGYVDGFGIVDTKTDSLADFYTTKNGLCSDFIGCLAEDSQGHLWLGSNSGISRYSKHQKIFYNYYISGNNRSVLLYNNFLFWGNNKNITYFHPANIHIDPVISDNVLITQIEVDNKPVEIGEKINGQLILSQGIPYTPQVKLTNINNSFSLLYSTLSYSDKLQKYSYRLNPYQSEWAVSEEGEKVSYVNLPSGKYVFEVKSIFPDGNSGKTTTLAITVLPHWSELTGVRLGTILFAVLLVYAIIRLIMKKQFRLAREERLRHELSITHLERKKEQQINKERNNFYTNVSHELRTPLTLILWSLQELLQSRSVQDKLTLIYNNASFLSGLVDQLLYIQKIDAGMVRLRLSEVELVELVKVIMAPFRPLAESKKTEFFLNCIGRIDKVNWNEPFHPAVETCYTCL